MKRVTDEWLQGMRAHAQRKTTHDPLVQLTRDEADAVFGELIEYRSKHPPESAWKVTAFNVNTLRGVVETNHRMLRFHSTSFQADTSRWPRVGEEVEVVFNTAGDLLSVHGK